jgi:hypothetical protein
MVLITTTIHADPNSSSGGVLNVSFPPESEIPSFRVPLTPDAQELQNWK